MKIIEPIENLGALSTNDAPSDQLDEWAPVGRDLLRYLDKPVFDIVGDTLIAASSTSAGSVYSVDLSSGAVTEANYYSDFGIANIDVSPDGLYVFIVEVASQSTIRCRIVTLSSGAINYSSVNIGQQSAMAGLYINNCSWSSDSSSASFVGSNRFFKVQVSTWVESSVVVSGISITEPPLTSIIYSGTHFFVANKEQIAKLNTDGSNVLSVFQGANDQRSLVYNNVTSELFVYINLNNIGLRLVNQSNLTTSAAPASISGIRFNGPHSIRTTATQMILRSASVDPYWKYYNLNDYSFAKSLPSLTDAGEGISVGTNYTVIQQDSGIETLLNLDDSLLSQTNPNVTAGDEYIYGDNIYEVLIDNDDQPDEGALLEVHTWLDRGKINPLRMFDGKLDSLTTSSGTLTVTINPERMVSGIALFNVDAAIARVTMTDPTDGLVYDSGDISMIDNSGVTDWFAFFFSPYIKKSDFVSMILPPYPDAEIVVTVDGLGAQVSIGEVVLGRTFTLGVAQFGSSVGILDFSEKEQDQFGNFNIIERKFSKRADYDVKIPTNTVSGVQRTLSKFRARPAVWVGDESREETIVYGYYKSFDIVLSNPALSDTSILVEGL